MRIEAKGIPEPKLGSGIPFACRRGRLTASLGTYASGARVLAIQLSSEGLSRKAVRRAISWGAM